jgi:Leucine-rich repeat (LRR) protein
MINKLRRLGVVINPVAQDNPSLSANFVNVLEEDLTEAIQSLLDIHEQLVFLYLDDQNLSVRDWETIGQLSNLRKLSVSGTNLNEATIMHLGNLNKLVYLNLVGTEISTEGLLALSGLDQLKYLYLYQTGLSSKAFMDIASKFPKTIIDTGNYTVPILASDTTVLRMKQ